MHWLCFKTNTKQEFIAKSELVARGFKIILPYYMRTISHARKKTTKPYPLFPSYGFLYFDGDLSSLNILKYTKGVKNYLHKSDGYPKIVPKRVIEFIQSLKQEDGSYTLNYRNFKKGEKVNITEGVFSGISGIFDEQVDDKRSLLLVDFLGRLNFVKVNMQMIERA
ncbi:MAG: hypothetical protein CMI95_01715 [Pelagibacteraceae bacterium]|nr:hypothetical protein [Pelagibacteraceae bacterium]PPR51261.1 MAG: Transcription antitermination protein RfaH [Alphaproteobacteria bacterium MarineAlpha5_Bin10]|tara:strand:- start:931 stop:1428 length:498 start_codon:yes stop_codon:yes gene_type:complete